jgi:Na+/melibiose symporter-like transporter
MKPHPIHRLVALASISFALTIATNTLEPSVYGHKILELVPDRPNTALGLITFLSSLVAIIVPPIVGKLSDRSKSRFGPRIPYLGFGAIFLSLGLYLIAVSPTLGIFISSVILFQLAYSVIVSPWQALYPDMIHQRQRGTAAGIRGLADVLGLIIGRKFAGDIVGQFDQLGQNTLLLAIAIPAVAIIFAFLITAVSTRNYQNHPNSTNKQNAGFSWKQTYLVDIKSHPAFIWWFANRFLFWAAFTTLATFLLFFAIDVIGLAESVAQVYLGNLALILGSAILIITLPAGWIADKIGRKPLVVGSGFLAALGSIIFLFVRDLNLLFAAGAIIGLAAGIYVSANFALITDIVPSDEAGRYLGVAGIAGASGGALARLIGGILVDPINSYFNSNSAGYLVLYSAATILFLLSAVAALRLPVPDESKLSNSE